MRKTVQERPLPDTISLEEFLALHVEPTEPDPKRHYDVIATRIAFARHPLIKTYLEWMISEALPKDYEGRWEVDGSLTIYKPMAQVKHAMAIAKQQFEAQHKEQSDG